MSDNVIIQSYTPLPQGPSPWPTVDPFLFCVHHHDQYPAGQEDLSPKASLVGRAIGSDFSNRDGWSMYHGRKAPGFPEHPHRGFETVTLARQGFIDHSDSLGATARFGQGDAQWMTAGGGVVHCEMFPLLNQDSGNPTELFQIWLNLPSVDKMVPAYFTMLWAEDLPTLWISGGKIERASVDAKRVSLPQKDSPIAEITIMCGSLGEVHVPKPPPNSWASRPQAEVGIWSLRLQKGAGLTLPAASQEVKRTLYVFNGDSEAVLKVGEAVNSTLIAKAKAGLKEGIQVQHASALHAHYATHLYAEGGDLEVLILQGRPIGEPVVQHGPFVMNRRAEIVQTIRDYQNTGFGGWGWGRSDPTHPREAGRFAIHADGREERRGS